MNDINNDTNLREAVSRREQQLPPIPADLNERLMQRLQERPLSDGTPEAPQSRNSRIRLYTAIAASILLIIGIGTVLFTDKPIDNSLYTSHQEKTLYTSHQTLYTSRQMETQHKPEGLKRRRWCVPIVQAGVKTLQKQMVTLAPKGRQNIPPPLRGQASRAGELPDTLGDGIWKSEKNVLLALQMLSECKEVIEESEQATCNNIIEATFNAMPQPPNVKLVTNESGDYLVSYANEQTLIEI